MSIQVKGVQPSLLRWARETQGYAVEEVAHRLKRTEAEIEAWEAGTGAPTYAQLEEIAYKIYKRPLAVFFLPAPPPEPPIKEQFRTLPDFEIEQLSADTRYQLRLADAYRCSLRELSDGVNPAERKIFSDISVSERESPHRTAAEIRAYLGVTIAVQVSWKSADEALKAWRNCVENAGVFVFKHAFKQEGISGLCLADEEFPLIYLNNSSTKTRQIFTLFHELAHLLLKVSTISKYDQSYVEFLQPKDKRIEQFCNTLAAEILVPLDDFTRQLMRIAAISDKTVETLADRYCVSREAVLRRLLDLKRVSQSYYDKKAREWNEAIPKGGSGGNYYLTQAVYLGDSYLRLVFGKLYQGKLSHEQAAEHLGVKTKNLPGLEEIVLGKQVMA